MDKKIAFVCRIQQLPILLMDLRLLRQISGIILLRKCIREVAVDYRVTKGWVKSNFCHFLLECEILLST